MRKLSIALGLVVMLAFIVSAKAEDDGKEVSLKGTITCAKCDLGKADKCATVVVVKKDDKETIYYFAKESDKKYHKDICKKAKTGEVKGTCKKDGDKLVLTVKELKYDK